MEGQYYKAVGFDAEGTKQSVNYVGVHPLVWHDHPKQPELGFTEVDIDIPGLRGILNDIQHHIEATGDNDQNIAYLKAIWNRLSDFITKLEAQ